MESAPHNPDSDDEKSTSSSESAPRRAALPASFLHGERVTKSVPKVELPKGLIDAPKIEMQPSPATPPAEKPLAPPAETRPLAVIDETALRSFTQEFEQHQRAQEAAKEADEDSDEDTEEDTTGASVVSRPAAAPPTERPKMATGAEVVASPSAAPQMENIPQSESEPPVIEGEIRLHDDINPLDLDPPVSEAASFDYRPAPPDKRDALDAEIETFMAQEKPRQEREQQDFAAWEQELAPAAEKKVASSPEQTAEDDFRAWQEEQNEYRAAQATAASGVDSAAATAPLAHSPNASNPQFNTQSFGYGNANVYPTPPSPGSGGNLPPTPPGPPFGPGGQGPNFNHMPGGGPNALPNFFNVLSPAQMMLNNNKLNYLEARRLTGDAAVGVVAGWALFRTFKNRRMIKENQRQTKQQFESQNRTITQLQEQNDRLQQRVTQTEQQPPAFAAAPNSAPNRVPNPNIAPRPAVEAAPVSTPDRQAEAEERARQARERLAQAHAQEERQRAPEVPEGRHIERSQWHSMEVDNKTGKVVENPATFAYGEAFQQERRQEQFQDPLRDNGVNGAQSQSSDQVAPERSTGQNPQMPYYSQQLPFQQSAQTVGRRVASPKQQVVQQVKNPWLWIGVGFIILVFFAAAVL